MHRVINFTTLDTHVHIAGYLWKITVCYVFFLAVFTLFWSIFISSNIESNRAITASKYLCFIICQTVLYFTLITTGVCRHGYLYLHYIHVLFVSEWKHCMFLVTIILTIAYYICGFIYLIGKLLHFIFVDVYI